MGRLSLSVGKEHFAHTFTAKIAAKEAMFRFPISVALRCCTTFASEQATVYVTSLPWISGKGQLIDYFRQFGPVASVYLPYNEKSGFSRGYALVRFRRSSDAEKAVQGLHQIDGRQNNKMINLAMKEIGTAAQVILMCYYAQQVSERIDKSTMVTVRLSNRTRNERFTED
ncbi:hypothetical protein D918_03537 [Trichuris suis]|nr:hypothetical protein D918_03537 [Trichuris suis]